MKYVFTLVVLLIACNCKAQWQLLSLGSAYTDYKVNDLYFINDSVGFAACWIGMSGGAIFKTTDGALSWMKVDLEPAMFAVTFTSPDTGYAVGGMSGNVYRTTDGGETWPVLNNLYPWSDLHSIYFKQNEESFIGSSDGFFLGDCPTPFLHSNDGWITWDSVMIDNNNLLLPNTQVKSFYFLNDDTGFAASRDNVFRTFDAGHTWEANVDIGNALPTNFFNVFEDSFNHTVYVCGSGNVDAATSGSFFYSSDYGDSWSLYQPDSWGVDSMDRVYDGQFINASVGYLVGGSKPWWLNPNDGGIVRTTDGGLTWQDDYVVGNNAITFFTIHCPTPQTCYCGGYNGVIMKNEHADSVTITTSTSKISSENNFRVYPNPANDIINISYKTSLPSRCIISDLNGRTVKEFQLTPAQTKTSINTNDLVAGVYIIEIKSEGKTERSKLVIMR